VEKSHSTKLQFGNILGKKKSGPKEKKKNIEIMKVLNEGIMCYPSVTKDPWHRFTVKDKNIYIGSLEFSCWNPPPSKRKAKGDFFYLKLVTYEQEIFHLTAFSRGFFINKISDQVFDPSSNSEPFFSILDLIASKSPHFKYFPDNKKNS
jgi:hypothetical protein